MADVGDDMIDSAPKIFSLLSVFDQGFVRRPQVNENVKDWRRGKDRRTTTTRNHI